MNTTLVRCKPSSIQKYYEILENCNQYEDKAGGFIEFWLTGQSEDERQKKSII